MTDSYGEGLEKLSGLGFLKGSACPHFDGEAERRPTYLKLIREGGIQGGIALDDGAGTLFVDEKISETVSSRKAANGYLFKGPSGAKTTLKSRFLGTDT